VHFNLLGRRSPSFLTVKVSKKPERGKRRKKTRGQINKNEEVGKYNNLPPAPSYDVRTIVNVKTTANPKMISNVRPSAFITSPQAAFKRS
jgi:hypothetical protein